MGCLDDLGSDVLLLPIFKGLAASSQMPARVMGLAGQIQQGVPGAVVSLVDLDWTTIPPLEQSGLSRSVCEYRSTDTSGIAALGSLTDAKYGAYTVRCAIYALREIHTKEALPFLERLLDSSSSDNRYNAVIGIAQFRPCFPIAKIAEKPAMLATFRPAPNVTDEMRQHYPAIDLFQRTSRSTSPTGKNWLAVHVPQ